MLLCCSPAKYHIRQVSVFVLFVIYSYADTLYSPYTLPSSHSSLPVIVSSFYFLHLPHDCVEDDVRRTEVINFVRTDPLGRSGSRHNIWLAAVSFVNSYCRSRTPYRIQICYGNIWWQTALSSIPIAETNPWSCSRRQGGDAPAYHLKSKHNTGVLSRLTSIWIKGDPDPCHALTVTVFRRVFNKNTRQVSARGLNKSDEQEKYLIYPNRRYSNHRGSEELDGILITGEAKY